MSSEPKFVSSEQTDNAGQDSDPGKSFVIRRRDGSEWTVLVSEGDFERVSQLKWYILKSKTHSTPYAATRTRTDSGKSRHLLLHWFVAGKKWIDHRNANGLDNRRSNLREATPRQNQHNKRKGKDNTSGYKGIWLIRRLNRWAASIRVDGKKLYLGSFPSPEEAHAAYCEAATRLHKEFARFE